MEEREEVPFGERVLRVVQRIPYGRVATYGGVAAMAGHPRAARGVGAVLRGLPEGTRLPWWRVIGSGGRITYPHPGGGLQSLMLQQEGVTVRAGGRVDLRRHGWNGEPVSPAAKGSAATGAER